MFLFFNDIAKWLQQHQLTCPLKKYLGITCPGCGMQRSFIALLNGDIKSSFMLHPVTIPLIAFFLYAVLHLIFRYKNGNKVIVYFYLFVTVLIVTNYIYRVISKTL